MGIFEIYLFVRKALIGPGKSTVATEVTGDMDLGKLICGNPVGSAKLDATLLHMRATIELFGARSLIFLNSDFTEESRIYSAFCGRIVLENSCAALVGRLDPFRLLFLREQQTQPTFSHGKPVKSGFKWQGDVMSIDIPPGDLWKNDLESSKISRSLLSDHTDHLFWRPAFERLLEKIDSFGSAQFPDITSLEPHNFTPTMKGRLANLYSSLSKGVHWEFFAPEAEYDEATLKDKLRDLFVLISMLGLTAHFSPTAYASMSDDDALSAYLNFRGAFQ